jgi:hypothetical protein
MKLVNIYSAAGLLEAEMLKAFLEAQGVDVYLSQESVGRTLGLSAGTLGRVNVMVPEPQAEEAKKLLIEIAEGEFDNYEYPLDFEENSFPKDDDAKNDS